MASDDPPGAAAIGARAPDSRGAAVTGPGAADDPVPGWLATTCKHEGLAFLRRSRFSTPVADEHLDRLLGGVESADQPVLAADQHATLWQAFLRLSEGCQRLLRALVVDAEDGPPSYRQVAAALQVPVGSLGPTRARCLDQLRKLLAAVSEGGGASS